MPEPILIFIDADACLELGVRQGKSGYGEYVMAVAKALPHG